jgi:hypothetical protein
MPGFPKWSLSFRFSHQNPVYASPLPHTRDMPHPSHSSRFYLPNNTGPQQLTESWIQRFSPSVPPLPADTTPCPHISLLHLSEESIHDQRKPQTSPVVKLAA